jgi:beta-lactamase class A
VLALVLASPLVLFDGLTSEPGPVNNLAGRLTGQLQALSSDSSPDPVTNGGTEGSAGEEIAPSADEGTTNVQVDEGDGGQTEATTEPSLVQPSPAAAAYAAVAPALPGVDPSSMLGTFQSTDDPTWTVTEIEAPTSQDDAYTVYTKKVRRGWEARLSVLPNTPDYPDKGRAPLVDLPGDLRAALYPEPGDTVGPSETPEAAARKLAADSLYLGEGWKPVSIKGEEGFARARIEHGSDGYTHAYLRRYEDSWYPAGIGQRLTGAELPGFPGALVAEGSLPEAGPAMVPTAVPVLDEVPEERRGETEEGLKAVRETVEGYEGTVGMYVQGESGSWGYGIRPDERFYTASVIKVPVMAAVYRKIEAGELSLSETISTKDRDYAGGAGGLQWQEDSVSHTIEDYLWMMITNSDNVATNVLVRTIGGPGYVNETASQLGATGTKLQHKVTDQRAAAPGLDNYTTPRDMASILHAIASGEAANEAHTEQMLGLLRENGAESWLRAGLPEEAEPACKVGWIGGVYNDVCLVQADESDGGPYIISIFSKHGPPRVSEGSAMLADISGEVWKIQDGEKEADKGDKEDKQDGGEQTKEG